MPKDLDDLKPMIDQLSQMMDQLSMERDEDQLKVLNAKIIDYMSILGDYVDHSKEEIPPEMKTLFRSCVDRYKVSIVPALVLRELIRIHELIDGLAKLEVTDLDRIDGLKNKICNEFASLKSIMIHSDTAASEFEKDISDCEARFLALIDRNKLVGSCRKLMTEAKANAGVSSKSRYSLMDIGLRKLCTQENGFSEAWKVVKANKGVLNEKSGLVGRFLSRGRPAKTYERVLRTLAEYKSSELEKSQSRGNDSEVVAIQEINQELSDLDLDCAISLPDDTNLSSPGGGVGG